jgi:broad specificity phosphatase PhoE
MARALYLTHPQVTIDPARAVHDWGLSDVGRRRAQRLADSGGLAGVTRVVSSAER